MNVSRDLVILLFLMGVGFLIGYGVAEGSDAANEESAAIIGAISSAGGMLAGYAYLAIEKWAARETPYSTRRMHFSPQVVGCECAKCTKKIVFVAEAFYCTECKSPFHRRCGKPPRCADCDERITTANRAILQDLGFSDLVPEYEAGFDAKFPPLDRD